MMSDRENSRRKKKVPGDFSSLVLSGAEDLEWRHSNLIENISTPRLWTCSPDLGAICPILTIFFTKLKTDNHLWLALSQMHMRRKPTGSFPNLSFTSLCNCKQVHNVGELKWPKQSPHCPCSFTITSGLEEREPPKQHRQDGRACRNLCNEVLHLLPRPRRRVQLP